MICYAVDLPSDTDELLVLLLQSSYFNEMSKRIYGLEAIKLILNVMNVAWYKGLYKKCM